LKKKNEREILILFPDKFSLITELKKKQLSQNHLGQQV